MREWQGGPDTVEGAKPHRLQTGSWGTGLLTRRGGDRRVEGEEAGGPARTVTGDARSPE